jgi:hypothetical protein
MPDVVTGGQPTIGLRVPRHPVALDLLDRVGVGLAAPSANRFGHVSATTADHVEHDFGETIDAVVDGGACVVGLESSIVDLSGEEPRFLRPRAVLRGELEDALGRPLGEPTDTAPRGPLFRLCSSSEFQRGKISAEVLPDVLDTGRRRGGRGLRPFAGVWLRQSSTRTSGLVRSEAMFSDLPVERRVATWVRRAGIAVGPPYFLDVIAKA